MGTIRKLILDILHEQDITARQLVERLGIKEKEVLEHLTHVQRSLGKRAKLIVDPARCLHCDYIFKDRDRLNTPGRCPKCRSRERGASHLRGPHRQPRERAFQPASDAIEDNGMLESLSREWSTEHDSPD